MIGFVIMMLSLNNALGTTIFSEDGDGASYRLFAGGNGAFPTQDLIVGKTDNASYNGIALFQLPDRQGFALEAAALTLTVQTSGTVNYANLDIWALGYVQTPVMNSTWTSTVDTEIRTGATLATNLGAGTPTKIADNFIASGVASGASGTLYQTSAPQNTTLLNFLNSLYDTYGAVAGDYAVIRINPDAEITDGSFQNIRFGGSHRTSPERRAMLEVTVVPEPTTAVMLGTVGMALLVRRNRARTRV